ncbi:WD40 repeat-like protein [Amniculicola lignicola CBS 123094]|uniref:WD40 repeat-like protein n=1 Tax=Amniculicola lignicola CBS 123094 TaxID=1392246 RepID=A0A6A5W6K6_9PLEO|nr:WD40 repeat-like protein [Amniculicola lignicola CBS 123094]
MAPFPTRPIARLFCPTSHSCIINCLSYSSDAALHILTGSSDRTIRLYNPSKAPLSSEYRNAGLVKEYEAHGYEVLSIAVAQDNAKFCSTGGDKSVFLWDTMSGQTIRRWSGHGGRVNTCSFGAGDTVIVTGSYDGTVKIWDCKSNDYKPIMTFSDAKDSISDLCVVGAEIVTGSVDGRVRSYDIRSGNCTVDVIGHSITSVAVTKAGTEMLVSTLDSGLRLMDRGNGQLMREYRDAGFVNEEFRSKSAFGSNESVVMGGSDDGIVYVWDLEDGEVLHRFKHSTMQKMRTKENDKKTGKNDIVSAVAFCPTRNEWASAGGDGNVVVWGL